MFITIEGIDGAGKSTHLEGIQALIESHGVRVVRTREPGGSSLAEKVRAMVLGGEAVDPMTEALLVWAARRDHVERVIRPALAQGAVVLCDRFADSTFAYQGGSGVSLAHLDQLEAMACSGLQPDLTLFFDVDPVVAERRRSSARAPDRFEAEDLGFFIGVRNRYFARRAEFSDRFVTLDAGQSIEAVHTSVLAALRQRGW